MKIDEACGPLGPGAPIGRGFIDVSNPTDHCRGANRGPSDRLPSSVLVSSVSSVEKCHVCRESLHNITLTVAMDK